MSHDSMPNESARHIGNHDRYWAIITVTIL